MQVLRDFLRDCPNSPQARLVVARATAQSVFLAATISGLTNQVVTTVLKMVSDAGVLFSLVNNHCIKLSADLQKRIWGSRILDKGHSGHTRFSAGTVVPIEQRINLQRHEEV